MLSDTIIKQYGIRVKAMVWTGLTIYGWDKDKNELTPPPQKWLYWNWNMSLSMGYILCGNYVIYICIQLSSENIENTSGSLSFATLLFAWGESILIAIVCISASRIRTMQNEILFTINQLFKYHYEVSEWIEERGITLDLPHKKRISTGELIAIIIGYASFAFPCFAFAVVFHPLEPIHNMVNDWLEFELTIENLNWSLITLVPPLFLSVLAAGNTAQVVTSLAICSYLVTVAAVEDMTPMQMTRKNGYGRYTFQTQFYGELTDEKIIVRYRVQQLFNVLTNTVYASLSISVHHMATLAVVCICAFFAIKFPNILEESGVVAYVIVFSGIFLGLLIEYLEATLLGTLCESSEMFIKQGRTLVGRRALLNVFLRSCKRMYVHAAYPFYSVDRTTFLDFLDALMDKTITLLL